MTPSLLLALLLVQNTPQGELPGPTEDRFNACLDLAIDDPDSGVVAANEWMMEGGSYFARHCLGFAYSRQQRFDLAAAAFMEGAREAALASDPRAANLWAQAGNAALAGNDAAGALRHFDAALAQGTLEGLLLGEIHLDRGRTLVALGRLDEARTELDLAHVHAAEDPLAWLLSAALARRMGDLARAQADIAVAAQLGPRDPDIGLEAGNIAAAAGNLDAARKSWEQVVAIDASGAAGRTAADYLEQLDAMDPATAPQPAQ